MPLFLGALVASVVSLVLRFRRSRGTDRQQLKWFALAGGLAGVMLPMSFALWYVTPVAGVLAAVALTALPLAAGAAILRYRLYDIDLFISRTIAYGAVTVLLASAYVAITLALGTTFGRGSAWTTAAATLVVALSFRPGRARVQEAVDRRFNRSRYDALRRMTDFLEDVRAGRAAPEDVQTVLREILSDPGLELLVFLPESQVYVDLAGVPRTDAADVGRRRISIDRGSQPLSVVLHDRTNQLSPDLLRKVVEAGGLAVEITRLRAELRLHSTRSRRPGPGSWLPAMPSDAGSSATSTTVLSSDWCPSAWRFGMPSTSWAPRPWTEPTTPLTEQSPRSRLPSMSSASSPTDFLPRSSMPALPQPSATSPGARRSRWTWRCSASGSMSASRWRRTSSAPKASPTPSSTPVAPGSPSPPSATTKCSCSPWPTTGWAAQPSVDLTGSVGSVLDPDAHHLRFDGTPLEFPAPRTPERIDLLVNAPNELHGAEKRLVRPSPASRTTRTSANCSSPANTDATALPSSVS
jgi:hypothetical protein